MYRATVSGLTANTSYRYYAQAALATVFGTTSSGAGNTLLPISGNFLSPSTPSFSTAGAYDTFTTDANGSYTGWFGFVYTGNAAFTAGNTVYPTITLNAGGTSTTVGKRLALDVGILVQAFATTSGANNCSFIRSTSSATAKNLVVLYDNVNGTGRPLAIVPAESIGLAIGSVITGYSTSAGAWSTSIPNSNANGVRRIEQRSLAANAIVGYSTDADGSWPTGPINTANPVTGGTAIVIAAADAPINSTTATPTINGEATASPFTTTYGTASTAQTFSISGANLSTDITATAPNTNFEVSSNGTTYGNTATFTRTGNAATGTLYVRLKSTAVPDGTYNSQNIVLSSTGATAVNIVTASTGNSVTAKGLTITGLTAQNKNWDNTTTASVTGTATFSGLVGGESLTPGGSVTWAFADANAGANKTLTQTGSYTVSSSNYTVTQPTLMASIAAVVPSAPTITGITAGNAQLSVAFAGPTSNGGASITNYEYSTNGGTDWAVRSPVSTESPLFIRSLNNGTNYNVQIRAVNSAGGGTPSVSTLAVPMAPSSPTVTVDRATFTSAFSTTYGTASSTQTFAVSGSTLNGVVTVTAPAGYEILTMVGGSYRDEIQLPSTGGVLANTTIYARLKAAAAVGDYNEKTFSVASASADTQSVATALSGNVVDPAPLTITGLNQAAANKTYDGNTTANVTGTATYSGLVNGESFSASMNLVTWAFPDKNVGTGKILAQTGTYAAPSANYTMTQPSLSADISAATLTVTGATVISKPYNGNTEAWITGAQLIGVISGDEVILTGGSFVGTFANANVGTGIAVSTSMGITGADAMNYSLTPPTGLTGEITKATAEITFDPLPSGKLAGDAAFSSGATATVGTLSYSSSNPNVATVDVNGDITPVAPGVTTITANMDGTANYNAASPVSRTLNVAAAGGSGTIAKWTFETSKPSATAASITAISAEEGTGTASGLHASSSTAWSNPVGNGSAESFSANYWANGDYFQFQVSTTGRSGISFSFDANRSSTGPASCKLQYSTDGTSYTDYGSIITINALTNPAWSSSSPIPSNYSFDLSSISNINNQGNVYFRIVATAPATGNTETGSFRVDNVSVNYSETPRPSITTNGSFSSALSTTYGSVSEVSATTVMVTGGTLTAGIVATAPEGFQVSNDGVAYDATATFAQTGGFANGTLYLRLAADAPAGSPSGNVVLSTTGATPVNVLVGASTVTAKALSVTAAAQTRIYGETDPTLTYTADGLVNEDTLAGSLSRAPGEAVGTYAINQGTLGNPNYNISFTGANLVITAATLNPTSITVNPPLNLTYDGNPKVHTATAIGVRDFTYSYAGVSPTVYVASSTAPTAAGIYTLTVTSSDSNYTGSKSVDFTIAKATPSITVPPTASAITAGQALSASVLSGGTASVTGAFSWTTPSTVPAVGTASYGVTFTPTDTANYNTATTTVSVTVNPAGSTYAGWSGGATLDSAGLAKYAIGGASSLTANDGVKPTTALTGEFLVITAIVRTDNSSLTVVGQAVTDLANYASNTSVTVVQGVEVADQNGVPTGHKRKTFSVAQGSDARKFMRLSASLALSGTNTTVSVARDSGGATFLQVTGATAGATSGGSATSDKRTVYYFASDTTSSPTFSGTAWPYVIVQGQLSAGAGVTATLTKNSSGVLLVNGLPAYQYGGDNSSTTASGVGSAWPAMRGDGSKTTTGPSGTIQ